MTCSNADYPDLKSHRKSQNFEMEVKSEINNLENTYLHGTDKSKKVLLYIICASALASIGGILFGYDIGIISGALLLLREEFHLTSIQQEMVVSSVLIGSFVASLFCGSIIDQFGRKLSIMLASSIFICGAIVICCSHYFFLIIIGRIIVGVAIALSVAAECTYISEIAPADHRGMLVSLHEVGITIGFLLAYLLNYLFISIENGWQYMFGVAIIPAILQIIGISFMPKSPHYLVIKKKMKQAEASLKTLKPNSNIEEEIAAIQKTVYEKKMTSYKDLISTNKNMRERMILAIVIILFQQFSGQSNVLSYAPIIFQQFGYCSHSTASLVTIGLGVVKVLSTIVTLITVDRIGRRLQLMIGCFFMAISLIVLGSVCAAIPELLSATNCDQKANNNTSHFFDNINGSYEDTFLLSSSSVTSFTSTSLPNTPYLDEIGNEKRNCGQGDCPQFYVNLKDLNATNLPLSLKIISVIALMVFVCAYGISYGPVTWLILSEIFPTTIRGRAISIATSVNWASNILISLTFLDFCEAVGVGNAYIIFGLISIAALFFVYFYLPETKNCTLEEIESRLSKGLFNKPWR